MYIRRFFFGNLKEKSVFKLILLIDLRSYSEVPRAGIYTNGYETDSGLVMHQQSPAALAYSTYRHPPPPPPAPASTPQPQLMYTQNGYVETELGPGQPYRVVNSSMGPGSYRTLGAPPTASNRYQLINDQSGYDTDTGLIKLRHVLDSTRRASSRNTNPVPIVHSNSMTGPVSTPTPMTGYVSYQQLPTSNGRCYTPQFSTGSVSIILY